MTQGDIFTDLRSAEVVPTYRIIYVYTIKYGEYATDKSFA